MPGTPGKRKRNIQSPSGSDDESGISPSTSSAYCKSPIAMQAKAMSEWQEDMTTVAERDWHMFQNEMYTDCTFSIGEGEEPTLIKCHRSYLAKTSPYFSSMLFGDMKQKTDGVIHLPEVNLKVFKAMLKYVYLGKLDLDEYSYEVVCGLLHLAKMYLLPKTFRQQLRHHLWMKTYSDHEWTAVAFGKSNDEPQIEKTAWQIIEEFTSNSIDLESFADISKSTLLNLVTRDHLSCSEDELFKACLRWAENEAWKQNLEVKPATLREILIDVIPHIRFLAMDKEKFATDVVESNLFTGKETQPIFIYHITGTLKELSPVLCTKTNARVGERLKEFDVIGYPEGADELCNSLELGQIYYENTSSNRTHSSVKFKKTSVLYGVQIPTQLKQPACTTETYEENLSIIVIKSCRVRHVTHVKKTVHYNTVIDVRFAALVFVNSNEDVQFVVEFYQTGTYPAYRDTDESQIVKKNKQFGDQHGMTFFYFRNAKYFHNFVYKLQ